MFLVICLLSVFHEAKSSEGVNKNISAVCLFSAARNINFINGENIYKLYAAAEKHLDVSRMESLPENIRMQMHSGNSTSLPQYCGI